DPAEECERELAAAGREKRWVLGCGEHDLSPCHRSLLSRRIAARIRDRRSPSHFRRRLRRPGEMKDRDFLAERFEQARPHVLRLAYRMLGIVDEADDAVQEAWIRLSRTDHSSLENLGAWLT